VIPVGDLQKTFNIVSVVGVTWFDGRKSGRLAAGWVHLLGLERNQPLNYPLAIAILYTLVVATSNAHLSLATSVLAFQPRQAANVTMCNFTDITVKATLCGFETGRNTPTLIFSIMSRFHAGWAMGALSLWQSSDFLVITVFHNLSVGGKSPKNAIIAWLDGSLQTGAFEKCYFIGCKAQSGKLIYSEASQRITFANCLFALSRELCLNEKREFLVLNSTRFGVVDFPIVTEMPGIGYRLIEPIGMKKVLNLEYLFLVLSVTAFAALLVRFCWGDLLDLIGKYGSGSDRRSVLA
jgi:hypothetical protein